MAGGFIYLGDGSAPVEDCAPMTVPACGTVIGGLYAIGNSAASAFGTTYPGTSATIARSLAYGYVTGLDAAGA